MIRKPPQSVFAQYQLHYASLVDGDPIQLLHEQQEKLANIVQNASDDQLDFAYAKGKWTLRESLIHLLDSERIFAYRALAISRGDLQTMTGYDQDQYMSDSDFSHVTKKQLLTQINVVRQATIGLYDIMTQEQLDRVGTISDYQNSAKSILFVIVGHCEHHLRLFKEKYIH